MQAPTLQQNENAWAEFSLQNISDIIINPHESILKDTTETESADKKLVQACNAQRKCQEVIAGNIDLYPAPLLNCVFASLETIEISDLLSSKLIAFHKTLNDNNTAALCLRAFSYCPNHEAISYIKQLIINEHKLDLEACVIISGRYWRIFENESTLHAFMHKLAALDEDFVLFRSVYTDLVRIPSIRQYMLQFIRSTNRSELTSKAIGSLFQQ